MKLFTGKFLKAWVKWLMSVLFLLAVSLAYVFMAFENKKQAIELEWTIRVVNEIPAFGSTQTLSILPLVNWHTRDDSLQGEAGVSYLIKTDQHTILFDVGFNHNNTSPSPLEHNMQQLNVETSDIDTIFLSHAHLDHSGGQSWVNTQTFSMGLQQVDLSHANIYAPTPTYYPGSHVNIIPNATVIGDGVASLGSISRQLLMGKIQEQALVIKLVGKGLVVIVGCGHQSVPKILDQVKRVFDEPIYGVVGDLHYPVPNGRLNLLGINLQRMFASGEGPHNPITFEDMQKEMSLLKQAGVQFMALGAHDTSDEVIEYVSEYFINNYHYVRVGERINVQ